MANFFTKLYTLWCAFIFTSVFLLLFPLFLIIIPFPRWHSFSFYLNRIWASVALFLVGIRAEINGRNNIDKSQQYVYCANHFSLLDILSFGFAPNTVLFVGKSSLTKVPLFGFMFNEIHVPVDRGSIKNSYNALLLAMKKMADNKSLVMFPEGGVYSRNPPEMVRFKDGAFRAAIEKQIPLVPVSLPYNWIILPDEKIPLIRRRTMRMNFHKPIPTIGLNMNDLGALKQQVNSVIQDALYEANKM